MKHVIGTFSNWCYMDQFDVVDNQPGQDIEPGDYTIFWPDGNVTIERIVIEKRTDRCNMDDIRIVHAFLDTKKFGHPCKIRAAGLTVERC